RGVSSSPTKGSRRGKLSLKQDGPRTPGAFAPCLGLRAAQMPSRRDGLHAFRFEHRSGCWRLQEMNERHAGLLFLGSGPNARRVADIVLDLRRERPEQFGTRDWLEGAHDRKTEVGV